MAVKLTAETKILELVKNTPSLMDDLIRLSPKLKRLNNPILQKTIGKQASLNDVSKMAKISVRVLMQVIIETLKNNGIEAIETDVKKSVKAEWHDSLANRQQEMKKLVIALHNDEPLNELKDKFRQIIADVSPTELAEMEQSLIDSGDLTAENVTKMCDLHVKIFQESLEDQMKPESVPGHPIHTYMMENEFATRLIEEIKLNPSESSKIDDLKNIILHYTRLENQLFPSLEKAGITGPSSVMWAIHDEIRSEFKDIDDQAKIDSLLTKIADMIYKEEKILFPMSLETLSDSDWEKVQKGEEEIGYAWVTPGFEWVPMTPKDIHGTPEISPTIMKIPASDNSVLLELSTGQMTLKTLDSVLRHIPVDISFIDGKEETVSYYSATEDRIFPRSPGVIGRSVQNCHPRKSLDRVQMILDAFKEGTKDTAEFWIQLGGKFIYIRYFAVKDEKGEYLGTLEVSQDITEIKKLEGNKRLLDW